MRRKDARTRVVLACLAVVLLAACGDSADNGAAGTPKGPGASGNSAADVDAGLKRASANVEKWSRLPDTIGITEPLKGSVKGTKVAFVQCGVQNCRELADAGEQVAGMLGQEFIRIQAGSTPETFQKGFQQAIDLKPDAVVYSGISRAVIKDQLKQLKDQGVKVLAIGDTDPLNGELVYSVGGAAVFELWGPALADWVIADSKGSAKAVFVQAPAVPFAALVKSGVEKGFSENCPDCTLETVDVQLTDIGRVIPQRIVSYLQQNPDTEYVLGQFGAALTGVPEALKAVGLADKVKLVSILGTDTNKQYVKNGEQAAELSALSVFYGWQAADVAARAILGQELYQDGPPVPAGVWLTQEDVTWAPAETRTDWQYVPGWRDQFKSLWAPAL